MSRPTSDAPKTNIAFVALDTLIPYANNARTHSDTQVAQIAASIAEWGFTNPVLADAQGVVAGHARVLGARMLYEAGQTIRLPGGAEIPVGTVPVIDCSGWPEAKRRAYVIADNKLALNAQWDEALLRLEFDELDAAGFDAALTGFDADELAELAWVPTSKAAPDEFERKDEDIATQHRCPKCGYEWSGSSR
jgi:ParB-like chromosome segregation protein Spo0J